MKIALMLIPTKTSDNLSLVVNLIVQTLRVNNLKADRFLPIKQTRSTTNTNLSMTINEAKRLLGQNKLDELLEKILLNYEKLAEQNDVIVIEGLKSMPNQGFGTWLNKEIAYALDADLMLLVNHRSLENELEIASQLFNTQLQKRIIGVLTNQSSSKINNDVVLINYADGKIIDQVKLLAMINRKRSQHYSPTKFCHRIMVKAREVRKRIALPEGTESRILQAATICETKKLAHCILIGNPEEINQAAKKINLTLNPEIEIVDPSLVRTKYVEPMMELRKHKGLTSEAALQSLQDNQVLATMMLKQGEIDGIVSGAINTTANTIRPALQLIKTKEGIDLVSSLFFMCLPHQVLVFADCAVNPNPSVEQLADVAIASADSAVAFGIDARVAMLSYSTLGSGQGQDVEKVKMATDLVKQKRPDILIDGPLQFDAAIITEVAQQKAPNSKIAGQATVFIFPDLDAGNIAYKAVQRIANLVSIGPIIQGLKKPVNDLSRGCLVEDIVFTVVVTAIQAIQNF